MIEARPNRSKTAELLKNRSEFHGFSTSKAGGTATRVVAGNSRKQIGGERRKRLEFAHFLLFDQFPREFLHQSAVGALLLEFRKSQRVQKHLRIRWNVQNGAATQRGLHSLDYLLSGVPRGYYLQQKRVEGGCRGGGRNIVFDLRVGVRNRVKKPREPIAQQKVATLKVETWNPLGGIFVVNAAFHRETPGLRPLLINRRVEPRNGLRGKRGNPDAAQRLSLRDLQVRGFPRGDAKLEFDEIDLLIDALCDEMLDLESRVDFHEEKAARGGVAEKLDSGCAFVVCLLRERERPGVELASLGVAEVKLGVRRGEESDAGRFFD